MGGEARFALLYNLTALQRLDLSLNNLTVGQAVQTSKLDPGLKAPGYKV